MFSRLSDSFAAYRESDLCRLVSQTPPSERLSGTVTLHESELTLHENTSMLGANGECDERSNTAHVARINGGATPLPAHLRVTSAACPR